MEPPFSRGYSSDWNIIKGCLKLKVKGGRRVNIHLLRPAFGLCNVAFHDYAFASMLGALRPWRLNQA